MSWYSIVLLAVAYIVVGCFFAALYVVICGDKDPEDRFIMALFVMIWPFAVPFAILVYGAMCFIKVFAHAISELFKTRTYKKS